MAATKKPVAKKLIRKNSVKKGGCPCGCSCDGTCNCVAGCPCGCGANDSVKYISIWAAWRAFWRRGFTEWSGTSSRSEYWLSWVGNLIVFILGCLLVGVFALAEVALFGHTLLFLSVLAGIVLSVYAIAWIIPAISMMTRRMHDAGLSAWVWILYVFSFIPVCFEDEFMYGTGIGLIIALLPTQIHGNRFHKNNR